jgi:hypothetical protein
MKINHPQNELKDKKTPLLSKQNEATAVENGLQSVLRWMKRLGEGESLSSCKHTMAVASTFATVALASV